MLSAAAHEGPDQLLTPCGSQYERSFERRVDEPRVHGVIVPEIMLDNPRVTHLLKADMPSATIGHTARPEGTRAQLRC